MGLSLKKFKFPWDVHTCPTCIKNDPIVCCRCHVVSQSQSMLGKFVGSLVYSARLWYKIVLKLIYLVLLSNSVISIEFLDNCDIRNWFNVAGWLHFRVLLVVSCFRKKFAGITSEKEILGSKHVIY